MPPIDLTLRKWWPSTQSLDLVEGPIERVAIAVREEFSRFGGQPATVEQRNCVSLEEAFAPYTDFYSIPISALLLPTQSRWTAVWYNTFLCSGYDSLCWCLTSHHRLTTLHWSSHDAWTTFQSGSRFCYRRHDGSEVVERSVHALQEDKKWTFFEKGVPLAEEDVDEYTARIKRNRLNERRVMEFLSRLGAMPWSEQFYALPGDVFCVSRSVPPGLMRKPLAQVLLPPENSPLVRHGRVSRSAA